MTSEPTIYCQPCKCTNFRLGIMCHLVEHSDSPKIISIRFDLRQKIDSNRFVRFDSPTHGRNPGGGREGGGMAGGRVQRAPSQNMGSHGSVSCGNPSIGWFGRQTPTTSTIESDVPIFLRNRIDSNRQLECSTI